MIIFFIDVLIFLASFLLKGKKGERFRDKFLRKAAWIPLIAFISAVCVDLAGFDYTELYDQFIALTGMSLFTFLPISLTYKLTRKSENKAPARQVYDYPVEDLPNNQAGRRKIVEKINREYNLNLTQEQITLIVNCSFQMPEWKNELRAMNERCDSIYAWFTGNTDWLRAYLRAFAVQNIVADMNIQKQIVLNSFDQVFQTIDMARYGSIHDCVIAINNANYTDFDDITFMVAYRMLEENGRKYPLPTMYIPSATNDIDELLKKYSNGDDKARQMR